MEYTVVIRKAPDGFYIASCPLVPEAHAQGETYEECMANIKEVLELCLEYRISFPTFSNNLRLTNKIS